jgi:glycosyltransferase involved in cell wall biosynthesis
MKSKKIAICSVQIPFMYGGTERLTKALHRELLNRDLTVDLVNIPFKWYPASRLITECMVWRMLDLTETNNEKIDFVISTKFPSTVVKHPDKRIWLFHQHRPAYDLYGHETHGEMADTVDNRRISEAIVNIYTLTIKEAKRIYTISENVSKRLRQFNGIDSLPLYPPPDNKERFYSDDYGDYVLYVGRLDAKKRISLLVNAFKFVRTNIQCLIVGTGADRDRLLETIERLDLRHKVHLLGYLPDDEVIRHYANALAVFYAPYDEDYGYATIEAFLSKRPVITTMDSGGVLEFVRHQENGFLTDNDPRQIAERVDWLYTNRHKCSDLGANGYELVKHISWDSVIERLVY